MMERRPRVVLIVLNWNGWSDTTTLVDQLLHIQYPNYRIIIVDNHSKNNEGERLRSRYNNQVDVIITSDNLGYSGGNNAALPLIQKGQYEYVGILNNDLTVEADFLNPLVTALESDPSLGLVSSVVFHAKNPSVIQSAGGTVSVPTGTVRLLKKMPHKKYVDFAPGSCFLARTTLWLSLKGFDEDYFAYWEEVDLSQRALRRHYYCGVAEQSKVFHKTAASSKYLSPTYVYYMLRNQLYFMRKQCPMWARPMYFVIFIVRNVLGYTFLTITRRSSAYTSIPRALKHGLFNKLTLHP